MKKINFKICFLFTLASLRIISMEEQPTEFLFAAMHYYEQGEYEKSAKIFKRYAGKPVPVAEPFCLDLVKKGYLQPFEPVLSNHEKEEEQEANMYFNAAREFLKIKGKKSNNDPKVLADCLQKAKTNRTGSFLYLIGTLYESAGEKEKSKEFFNKALKNQDLRGILGLGRVCPSEQLKKIIINNLPFSKAYQALSLMPVVRQDEGKVCATLSGFFSPSSNQTPAFLRYAALFGHSEAQFLWGQSHCRNESQILYWMMQSAAHGNLEALSLCGHMLERGKGTSTDYEKAYDYLKRAAYHPEATFVEFFNFAGMHKDGKGTPIDYQAAGDWYKKACEADPSDQEAIYQYGRVLGLVGDYQKALPLLSRVHGLSDDSAYDYAVALEKLRPEEGGDLTKAVSIVSQLAVKGYADAANALVTWAIDDKAPNNKNALQTYKSYLEKVIQNLNSQKYIRNCNQEISKAYFSLRSLYGKERSLFPEDVSASSLSGKAFQFNPQEQPIKLLYAKDLHMEGSYQEALNHLLSLEKAGHLDIFNIIGASYDLLAQQAKKPSEVRKLIQNALAYYQKEVEANGSDKKVAAFNIYCLLKQERISLPFEGSLLYYLQMAADGGDEQALNDLGIAYQYGFFDLDQDLVVAERYLKRAVDQGLSEAKINLMNLKFTQRSEKDREEGIRLYNELWEAQPETFEAYLKRFIESAESVLNQVDKDDFFQETGEAKEEKAENGPILPESKDSEDLSGSLLIPLTEKDTLEPKEEERPAPAMSLKQQEELPQSPVPVLTKRQKKEQEEKNRLQKKYRRLMEVVENLRGKRQVKYRKIQAIMEQHVDAFGGAVKNAKGSGRRIQLGSAHSGFHRPHGRDRSEMKGGALGSVAGVIQQSHESSSSSHAY